MSKLRKQPWAKYVSNEQIVCAAHEFHDLNPGPGVKVSMLLDDNDNCVNQTAIPILHVRLTLTNGRAFNYAEPTYKDHRH
jgi:hypothetical protein